MKRSGDGVALLRARRGLPLIVVALGVLLSSPARAASWFSDDRQALPCRPTIACTADIVPPGSVEIEVGYLLRDLHDPAGSALQHSLPLLLKLTLTDWLQLQVGTNGLTLTDGPTPSRFVDDLVTGLKLHLAEQTRTEPSFSLSVALSSPLDAPAAARTVDLLTTLYFTKDIGRIHADLNLGLDLWRVDGPTRWQPWAALALSVELPRHVTAMGEVYYFYDAAPIAPRDAGLLLALAYAPRPWVVVDAGGDLGLLPSGRAFSVFVGMTILPVDLWQTAREQRRRNER